MRRRGPPGLDVDLREMVRAVVDDYARFLRDAEADPKTFGARHAAARAALTHLESLLKLAQGGDAPATDDVTQQLREMREAMAKDPDPDDEGDPG